MSDLEEEYHRRRTDASIRTEQKLDDFLSQYEKDQVAARSWRETIERRLRPLEAMKVPYRIGLWFLIVLGSSGIGLMMKGIYDWANRHMP